MSHNTVVIEVLIAVVLLVTIIVAVRILMYGGSEEHAGGAGLSSELETSLKKMMEQVQKTAPASGDGSSASPEELAKYQGEIAELRKQLEGSQKQIEELKQAPAAGSGGGEAAQAQLNQQLQELQAKLAEYEIISEDIADLSNYKEQNAKLQKEIQELRAGGASAPAAAAPIAAPAPTPQPAVEPEPVQASVAEAVAEPVAAEAPAVVESVVEPAAPAAAPVEEAPAVADPSKDGVVDDDLMAEFAAAVAKQKEEEEEAGGVAAPPPATAAEPLAETKVEATPVAAAEAESTVDLGAMNIDKVLEEATHIPDADGTEITVEQALGQGVDENKILEEATALDAEAESSADQPSEDQKLMNQFESFVKKENT